MFDKAIEWEPIGLRLKAFRASTGENQRDFARIMGVWQSKIAKIEKCMGGLTLDDLVKLHETFGLNIHWLLTGCEPKKENNQLGSEINYELIEMKAKIEQMEREAYKEKQLSNRMAISA